MKKWIHAARLRTLPLSVSGIILGSLIALSEGYWNWWIFVLAFLTTLFLQILSNYANDYGDGIKGTDTHRVGEKRIVAAGEVTPGQMKTAIVIFSALSAATALILIYVAFKENFIYAALFIFLTFACVWAAIKYTVGRNAYGYAGLGDLFVFLFFGIISVWGSYTLYEHGEFNSLIFLPSVAVGLLSTAVLNLNNMRDMDSDSRSGKQTVPLKIGFQKAKVYQSFLLLLPFVLIMIYLYLSEKSNWFHFLYLILLIPAFLILKTLFSTEDQRLLDKELKKVALLTLAFSLILGISLNF